MSQAYQAPQVAVMTGSEPALPMQRPNPKLLARRAVNQAQARTNQRIQPQRLVPVPPRPGQSTAKPTAKPTAKSAPRVKRVPMPAPTASTQRRIQIDWEARLREARQRIATAQARKAAAVKAAAPAKVSPKKLATARVGSAIDLSEPIGKRLPPSIRQRGVSQPVIRSTPIDSPKQQRTTPDRAQRPRSGSQLYAQRLNALRNGQLYTQIPVNSFYDQWSQASGHPSYAQWRELLALEARAAGRNKGGNNLTAMVGDSLSQWFPADRLPDRQLWLNQGISGDTTKGILDRISYLDNAKPDTIYLMAGVNDLKRGASERDVLTNLTQIVTQLKRQHPTAQIIIQSVLPTRSEQIPNDRITKLNPQLQELARRQGVDYLDLHQQFRDSDGSLRADLTTDGIHLSPQGYQVWQGALQRMDQRLAQRPQKPRTIAQAGGK
jgi:lysophospholipase L1-like esterase